MNCEKHSQGGPGFPRSVYLCSYFSSRNSTMIGWHHKRDHWDHHAVILPTFYMGIQRQRMNSGSKQTFPEWEWSSSSCKLHQLSFKLGDLWEHMCRWHRWAGLGWQHQPSLMFLLSWYPFSIHRLTLWWSYFWTAPWGDNHLRSLAPIQPETETL